MYKDHHELHGKPVPMGRRMFSRFKPHFVRCMTKDVQMLCGCIKHINIGLMFKALRLYWAEVCR